MDEWTREAARALDGRDTEEVAVFRGTSRSQVRPSVFPLLGYGFCAAMSVAVGSWASSGSDPLLSKGTVFVATALGFALGSRALVCAWIAIKCWAIVRASPSYAIALTKQGLLVRTPSGDTVIPIRALVGACVPIQTEQGVPYLHILTDPTLGRVSIAIPAVFPSMTDILTVLQARAAPPNPLKASSPAGSPSDADPGATADIAYAAVVDGSPVEGALPIRHGTLWLSGAPIGAVAVAVGLASVAFGLDTAQATLRTALWIGVAVFALGMPLWWFFGEGVEVAPRKGLSLVFTPRALLFRSGRFATAVPWHTIEGTRILTRRSWSVLRGWHRHRKLLWRRAEQSDVSYQESFLGVPAEIVDAWTEHYRSRAMRSVTPPAAPELHK